MSVISSMSLKLGVCQIAVSADKVFNIATARAALMEASANEATLAMLPECWNSPYSVKCFPEYAECVPKVGDTLEQMSEEKNPSYKMVSEVAKETNMWVIGGSIPERESDGKLYNTCLVFNPDGKVVAKHRKVHLFDIDVQRDDGHFKFKESDSLTAGDDITVVDTPWGGIGIAICYDIRFPELAICMRQKGCNMIAYPGAFNMITGPPHWELLQRARAVDNQVFVITCSPARDTSENAGYKAWGHSSIINPWGEVVEKASHEPANIYADLDLKECTVMRQNVPCWKQKRDDLYTVQGSKSKS